MSDRPFPDQNLEEGVTVYSGSDRGEEMIKRDGKEPGRYDEDSEEGRPAGKSTGRDATGVNPKEPIDPNSPTLIPE